jgi:uncharacterized protein (DUF1697 family)
MTTYVAMLRGININGHKIIKMERLRAAFVKMGFHNVRTYIASGNVVFETEEPAAGLSPKIREAILKNFGYEVHVVTKTAKEMAAIVKRNPLVKDKAVDQSRLYVTFLSDDPPRGALGLVQPLLAGAEQIHLVGRAAYLYCPKGYSETKLHNNVIEKKFSCNATTRNWNTTKTLLEMAKGVTSDK